MITPINFDEIKSQLISYLSNIRTQGQYPFPLQEGSEGSVYGTCFAVLTAELLNYQLPEAESIRKELRKTIDDETGLATDPALVDEKFPTNRSHTREYLDLQTTYFVRNALYALGEKALPSVKFAKELAQKNKVYQWLDDLAWENPWLVSNLDMFLGFFLIELKESSSDDAAIDNALEEYYRWHDTNQSPEDGFWGPNKDPLERMAGGYHIFVIYDAVNRKIPYLAESVEATRSLAWADKLFVYGGGGGSCEDMDAIDILVRGYLADKPKHNGLVEELVFIAERLSNSQNKDGGFSWRLPTKYSWLTKLLLSAKIKPFLGAVKTLLFKLKNRSHYTSTHLYSSCKHYPFKIDVSDTWSCWFRASAIAMIAKSLPEEFDSSCDWYLHKRPGLGVSPKLPK
jgi:hypothetical protein